MSEVPADVQKARADLAANVDHLYAAHGDNPAAIAAAEATQRVLDELPR